MTDIETEEIVVIVMQTRLTNGSWCTLYPHDSLEEAQNQYTYLTTAGPENGSPMNPDKLRISVITTTTVTRVLPTEAHDV